MKQNKINNCNLDINQVLLVIDKYFDTSILSAIMLSGSYAIGNENSNSDIDVVLVSQLSNRQTSVIIQDSGLEYQFIIFPINKLSHVLCDDIIQSKFVFYSIFKQGVIIFDSNHFLFNLARQYCLYKPKISEKALGKTIVSIIENCKYIETNGNNALTAAMSVITNLQKLIIGELSPSAKHIDKKMLEYSNERVLLYNALTDYIVNKNNKIIPEIADKFIKNYGIPKVEIKSSTSFLQTPSSDKYLMVFIPNTTIFEKIINKLCKDLYSQLDEISIFAFYVGNCQMMKMGTYICVTSKNNNVIACKNKIIKIINKTDYTNNVIISPYNTFFFDINLFGEFRNNVYSFLNLISSLRMEMVFESKEDSIMIAYLLMLQLKNINSEIWDRFVVDAINYYLPEIVDYNDSVDHTNLVTQMHKQNDKFQLFYDTNKDSIYSTIKNNINRKDFIILHDDFNNLMKSMFSSNSESFNSLTLIYPNNGVMLNTIDVILSSLGLEPHEKYAVLFIFCNLVKDYVFI